MYHRIIGVDPGSESCGMVVVDGGCITGAWNLDHSDFWDKITLFLLHRPCTVVLEDIRPYSLRLTMQVISTAKFIGEALYRLRNDAGANVELITRSDVKKWVFDAFPDVCIPIIDKRIEKKGFVVGGTGEFRKASFVFVNDKIVTEAMKNHYDIPKPPAGSGYKYGLKDHSWQALAVATFFKENRLSSL